MSTTSPDSQPNGCPLCGHSAPLPHDLGAVCPMCGYVQEESVFEERQPTIKDRNHVFRVYHDARPTQTTIGTKKERGYSKHLQRMAHIQYTMHSSDEELAAESFKKWIAFFDAPNLNVELMQIFKKIFPRMIKYSRSKNVEKLTFTIFCKVMQTRCAFNLRQAGAKAQFSRHKVHLVLKSLNKFDHIFCTNEPRQIQSLWSRMQDEFGLGMKDLEYMQKMYDSGEFFGMVPTLKAMKILILYYKAQRLQEFFLRLRKAPLVDWADLLAKMKESEWVAKITADLPRINLTTLAKFFKVSPSQVYLFNQTETWQKTRLIKTPKNEVMSIGWCRIPEVLFDQYFGQRRTQSYRTSPRTVVETETMVIPATTSEIVSSSNTLSPSNISSWTGSFIDQASPKLISNSIFSSYPKTLSQKVRGNYLKIPQKPANYKGILGSPPPWNSRSSPWTITNFPRMDSQIHQKPISYKGILGSSLGTSTLSRWNSAVAFSDPLGAMACAGPL
ncbi:MAG: hypothetical protein E4G98_06760 [Promethearchaeota archaeon]|nr:MAG: hypothetical protein E4G98_06760 [Candidatus Lokiarchaeota archaeon]